MNISEIPEKIKVAREARGWSQKELAAKCGWFDKEGLGLQSRVGNYEQGRVPKLEHIETLCETLEVTIGYLLSLTPGDFPQSHDLFDVFVSVPDTQKDAAVSMLRGLGSKKI
jgi:transcriptional regulator with XRE-family HTH domain